MNEVVNVNGNGHVPTTSSWVADSKAMEVLRMNLCGELPNPDDFPRIRVPAGGSTVWEIPTLDGSVEAAKAIEGVIVYIARRRAYWSVSSPTGDPPQCVSLDCETGIGDPGGACATCPNNQFGTVVRPDGSTGRGKACKESKLLFILRNGQALPDVVVVPPGSLRSIRSYQFRLGVPYWSVVTRLSLERTKNRDGIDYAQIRPTRIAVLDPATAATILEYAKSLQSVFAQTQVEHDDFFSEQSS